MSDPEQWSGAAGEVRAWKSRRCYSTGRRGPWLAGGMRKTRGNKVDDGVEGGRPGGVCECGAGPAKRKGDEGRAPGQGRGQGLKRQGLEGCWTLDAGPGEGAGRG